MENICNILATNIQTYRKKSGMTQEELARSEERRVGKECRL